MGPDNGSYVSHHIVVASGAASRHVPTFLSFVSLVSAKASERYSVLPSHSSISTRPCEPASACVDLVCERCGISKLTTPPRSTDRPGSPIGSYSAEDS